MSASVINNSWDLHEYRNQLSETIQKLDESLKKTEAAVELVGETWKDDNFREFQENFNQDKEMIIPLIASLDDYVQNKLFHLEEKVRELEEFRFGLNNLG